MLEFLTADQNLAFSVALAIMAALAVLEGVSTLLGAGISHLVDSLLPNVDLPDIDAPEVDSPGPISGLLGWLYVGKVPFLILFIVMLTSFGIGGLVLQSFVRGLSGGLLPAAVAVPIAIVGALPMTRFSAGLLARWMPQDETEAVSRASFVGRIAVITLGVAKPGSPAQARLHDQFGQTQYVMVEPDGDEPLPQGTEVLLIKQAGHVFKAIPNPNPHLTDS